MVNIVVTTREVFQQKKSKNNFFPTFCRLMTFYQLKFRINNLSNELNFCKMKIFEKIDVFHMVTVIVATREIFQQKKLKN